jgi:hypothetical protein
MEHIGLLILIIIISIMSILGVCISCYKLKKVLNGEESDDDESEIYEKSNLL